MPDVFRNVCSATLGREVVAPSSPFMHPVDRPLPAVQRAYFYLVALVAIHMVVLAVANLTSSIARASSTGSRRASRSPFLSSGFPRG